ncbi:MAG: Hsp33 family molecular chaperone HslO [Alphaproteobacteria bacterium]
MTSVPPGDDLVQTFNVESLGARGRLVRLGAVAESVIGGHDYPELVAGLLGEMLALAAALAAALRFEGVFSVQTKGDGPVSMLVADITSDRDMRGYAAYDEGRLDEVAAAAAERGATPGGVSAPRLLGAGHMAFTVDQGAASDRHQGIVELDGATVAEIAHQYFRRSEPIETGIRLAAGRSPNGDGRALWRAGALVLQHVALDAKGGDDARSPDPPWDEEEEENWRRAMVLMGSLRDGELLDPRLTPEDLLSRLFHEERVRVFRPKPLHYSCRCSEERVERVLASLPRDEMESLKIEGEVVVTCQFCNARYSFDDAALAALYEA